MLKNLLGKIPGSLFCGNSCRLLGAGQCNKFVLNSEGCSYVFRASSVKMCKMGINCCTLQDLVNFIWDSEINQVRSQNDNREHYKFYNFCKFLNTLFYDILLFQVFFFLWKLQIRPITNRRPFSCIKQHG